MFISAHPWSLLHPRLSFAEFYPLVTLYFASWYRLMAGPRTPWLKTLSRDMSHSHKRLPSVNESRIRMQFPLNSLDHRGLSCVHFVNKLSRTAAFLFAVSATEGEQ